MSSASRIRDRRVHPPPSSETGVRYGAYGPGRCTVDHSCPGSVCRRDQRFPGEPGFPGSNTPEAAPIGATFGACGCGVVVYLPQRADPWPERPLPVHALLWPRCARLASRVAALPTGGLRRFNVAPTDADVWDPAVFVGSTPCSPIGAGLPGRAARSGLDALLPTPIRARPVPPSWDYP